jgi:threonine-phosphate decarboxylase
MTHLGDPPDHQIMPSLAPHHHGGQPQMAFHRLGLTPRSVIDFSVNVNPLGPPQEFLDLWPALRDEASHYPTPEGEGVRQFYGERFGLAEENVLPANGSAELIYLVPRVLKLKRAAVMAPSFHDYERALRLGGAETVFIPLLPGDSFKPPAPEKIEFEIAGCDSLFVGTPNNPTGTVIPRDDLLRLCRRHPKIWFLIDEAFGQFQENYEAMSLMTEACRLPNLLIFHSMTKFYGLPGLRLGALIGHQAALSQLREGKEPWTVNSVAEKAAPVLARCTVYEERTRRFVASERKRIAGLLCDEPGLFLFPGAANFFLARWEASDDLDDLLRPLLADGLCVRDCRNFRGLEGNYFRFAIRKKTENDLLCATLKCIGRGCFD